MFADQCGGTACPGLTLLAFVQLPRAAICLCFLKLPRAAILCCALAIAVHNVSITARADDLYCFGWTQESPRNTIVGEVRCKTAAGREMKSFLASLVDKRAQDTDRITILDYPDTIIRLHFSHFKVLSPRRNTCFIDEPHKCTTEELL